MWQNEALRQAGIEASFASASGVRGGCISTTEIWQLADGRRVFAKHETTDQAEMLRAEADGLIALAASGTLAVPKVFGDGVVTVGDRALLLSQCVATGRGGRGYYETFGRQLAELHRAGVQEERFGWHRDNFLGRTPQPNRVAERWADFFAHQRLEFQLRRAVDAGLATKRLSTGVARIVDAIDRWLPESGEPPALIHGDLWSGNYLADTDGVVWVIDPAVYRADREAEFGMICLFGGCPERFFEAYHESYPFRDRWRERVELYKLYHLLNHLNLFGGSYLDGCQRIAGALA